MLDVRGFTTFTILPKPPQPKSPIISPGSFNVNPALGRGASERFEENVSNGACLGATSVDPWLELRKTGGGSLVIAGWKIHPKFLDGMYTPGDSLVYGNV